MAGTKHSREGRIAYSFTLHEEEDADLIAFLEENKITRSVKLALRDYINKKKTESQPNLNLSNEQLQHLAQIFNNQTPNIPVAEPKQEENEEINREFEEIMKNKADKNGKVGKLKF